MSFVRWTRNIAAPSKEARLFFCPLFPQGTGVNEVTIGPGAPHINPLWFRNRDGGHVLYCEKRRGRDLRRCPCSGDVALNLCASFRTLSHVKLPALREYPEARPVCATLNLRILT